MEKVFIFDVVSKIYVATDSSPVDITMYVNIGYNASFPPRFNSGVISNIF